VWERQDEACAIPKLAGCSEEQLELSDASRRKDNEQPRGSHEPPMKEINSLWNDTRLFEGFEGNPCEPVALITKTHYNFDRLMFCMRHRHSK